MRRGAGIVPGTGVDGAELRSDGDGTAGRVLRIRVR
jgi:hypothetical protein